MSDTARGQITQKDVAIINEALRSGADVCIQSTGDGGYRIISQKPKVLKRSRDTKESAAERKRA